MPTTPTYVEIGRCVVKELFDDKYKSGLLKSAKEGAEKAIKGSSKLTDAMPKDKKTRGYSLDIALFMTLDEKTKKLKGKCEILVNIWPGKALHANAKSEASIQIDPAKVRSGDVDAILDAVLTGALKTAVSHMEKNEL